MRVLVRVAAIVIVLVALLYLGLWYSTGDSGFGTVRNSVREAMMMERRESSHGYRERTSGPVACRARPE
ncbi:hypothetical protein EN817_13740 [Mesorhizobium sp. M3A.F.Ca.ET.174.01.1.1]|nr:hypothetical protein EN818_13740 [Mesorhizobium sp. M3A.F.Ca.ET.175.01.1.1]TGT27094.1 hypothetical protein EN817_13740 [Mesorhizobium sp. M3A.F.Ca.ET.174.01.1.1]